MLDDISPFYNNVCNQNKAMYHWLYVYVCLIILKSRTEIECWNLVKKYGIENCQSWCLIRNYYLNETEFVAE